MRRLLPNPGYPRPWHPGNVTSNRSRTCLAYLLGTVVRHNSRHFPARRQFHEFSRVCSLLICVVEHDAVDAPEHVLKMKVEFRVGFQTSLKVSSQVWLPCHLSIRRPQKTGGNGRDQLDCVLIVRHDQVQIVGVPSRNPMIGQTPSFVFRQCRSLHLTAITARLKPRPFKTAYEYPSYGGLRGTG